MISSADQTARQNGLTRIWERLFVAFLLNTRRPGPHTSPGLNTPTTPWSAPPQVCLHSWLLMVSNLRSSHPRRLTWQCHPFRNIFDGFIGSGARPGQLSSARLHAISMWPTTTVPQRPTTSLDRRSGCHPGTCLSRPNPRN